MPLILDLNGRKKAVASSADTPLLYVLTDELAMRGPRFGCGLAQCGSCSVLIDGVETRSCVFPVGMAVGKKIVTLEGLPAWYAQRKKLKTIPALHPLQQAFVTVQASQCGYCFNGMAIKGAELLADNTKPSVAEIREAMSGHLCRCGNYQRIEEAIQLAAREMEN